VRPPENRVTWPRTHRLVLAQYPRVDLYEDVADPHDWEALALAQSRTNPRILDAVGDLSLVPVERRVAGDGASWVMGAFTHVSPDRHSRFGDGTYGVYYAGESLETAMNEHGFHVARFFRDSDEPPGWVSQVRELVGAVDAVLDDLRGGGFAELLDPDDYAASQAYARGRRAEQANGIVYPSVRRPGGECIAAFFPDVVGLPVQGDHLKYFWDGTRILYIRKITGDGLIYQL
jgi:hypothetical protein